MRIHALDYLLKVRIRIIRVALEAGRWREASKRAARQWRDARDLEAAEALTEVRLTHADPA